MAGTERSRAKRVRLCRGLVVGKWDWRRIKNGNGKGLIGMKVLGEGQLADRVDEALRFAVTKDAVHCFTIGCESRAEFEGNFARIAKVSQPG